MKAVVYNGPRDVAVKDVDDARIERPSDAIVRITTTNICASDPHMCEGRTDFEPGYGGGPVALMAAYSATIKGACKAMVVDCGPDRLRLAEEIGALPIDDSKESPVERASARFTGGIGVVDVFVPEDPGSPDEFENLQLDQAPEGYDHFDRPRRRLDEGPASSKRHLVS
jgi:threonine dehydrogenase-like Zn-dependent dehydrogenase